MFNVGDTAICWRREALLQPVANPESQHAEAHKPHAQQDPVFWCYSLVYGPDRALFLRFHRNFYTVKRLETLFTFTKISLYLAMGRAKYVEQDALNAEPTPTLECPVVRVLGPRGQHQHEVVVAQELVSQAISRRLNPGNQDWFTTLVELPPRFRSVVWVKRGGYVMADLTNPLTDKVAGEISQVLLKAQMRYLRQTDQWPTIYEKRWPEMLGLPGPHHRDDEGSDISTSSMEGNPNHRRVYGSDSDSSDSDLD